MIIFSSAFILSEAAAARPLVNARIGWQTWTRDLDDSAVTASTETEDGPKDSPLRPDTSSYWEPSAMPATWTVDLGTSRDVDYVGIVAELNGCAVEVETGTDASTWTALASEVSPGNDAPLMFLDDSRVCRYVRVTFTGDEAPKLAVVYAGEVLAMPRAIYGGITPPSLSRVTELESKTSRGGQIIGQSFKRHGVSGSLPFQRITAAWYRANVDPFVRAARRFPAFIAWRPETFPLEVIYAVVPKDIHPRNMGQRDFVAFDLPYEGVGHE